MDKSAPSVEHYLFLPSQNEPLRQNFHDDFVKSTNHTRSDGAASPVQPSNQSELGVPSRSYKQRRFYGLESLYTSSVLLQDAAQVNLKYMDNTDASKNLIETIQRRQSGQKQENPRAKEEQHMQISTGGNTSLLLGRQTSNSTSLSSDDNATAESSAGNTNESKPRFFHKLKTGWPKVVMLNCLINLVALTLNIALIVWASRKTISIQGTYTIWQGSKSNQDKIKLLSHVAINLVSTAIFAGNSYTLQVLLSPSRSDIDTAHSRKCSLDIGLSSLRNWPFMSLWKKVLYLLLVILMLPVHLYYNSIIVDTSPSFDIQNAGIVSSDFLQVTPFDGVGRAAWDGIKFTQSWTKLNPEDCQTYLSQETNPLYTNMVIITNVTLSQNTALNAASVCAAPALSPDSWFTTFKIVTGVPTLNPGIESSHGSLQYPQFNSSGLYMVTCNSFRSARRFEVISCLAENEDGSSTLELVPQRLLTMIFCNAAKILLLSLVLLFDFEPLVTTGDAIASFLDSPDPVTEDLGPLSTQQLLAFEIEKKFTYISLACPLYGQPWKVPGNRFLNGVKKYHWNYTILIWTIVLGISCLLLGTLMTIWNHRISSFLASPDTDFEPATTATSLLLVNSPQLVFSILYMTFNSLWTSMMLSKELVSYSEVKQGLRVTRPSGEQRGALFLSLPTKYFVPLFLLSLTCHWAMSQTVFVTKINRFEVESLHVLRGTIQGISYWGPGFAIIACMVSGLIIVTILFGLRHHDLNGPLIGSNSACISAVCHSFNNDKERESTKKIQHGVIEELSTGRTRVAFTSGSVRPLVVGEVYGVSKTHNNSMAQDISGSFASGFASRGIEV